MMRKILLLTYLLFAGMAFATSSTESLDGIAAVVNNQVVTLSEWKKNIAEAKKVLTAQHQTIPAHLSQDVLNDLIDKYLILSYLKDMRITTSDTELNKAIAAIATDNHLSVAQLYSLAEKNGISKHAYQEQIREQMTMQKAEQQQFGSKLQVTDQDIARAAKKIKQDMTHNPQITGYHLQHLWVPVSDNATPAEKANANQQAQAAREQLSKGADFVTLAKQYSNDPADWGMRPVNAIPEIFLNAISDFRKNQLTPVINTNNGAHLIKLIATKGAQENLSPKAVNELAKRIAFEDKIKTLRAEWVKTLRETAYIKIEAH